MRGKCMSGFVPACNHVDRTPSCSLPRSCWKSPSDNCESKSRCRSNKIVFPFLLCTNNSWWTRRTSYTGWTLASLWSGYSCISFFTLISLFTFVSFFTLISFFTLVLSGVLFFLGSVGYYVLRRKLKQRYLLAKVTLVA